jgi:hypothetical protein
MFVYPKVNTWYQVRNVETELLALPAYQALKKYDRETYDKLISDLKRDLQNGVKEIEVINTVRGHMTKVVQSRLSIASDHSVLKYMAVTMQELEVMTKKGGDLCYRFLFPQSGAPIDPRDHISKKLQDADLAALADVIKTSAEDPQTVPEESEIINSLQVVFTELSNEHGEDIHMLQDPTAPTVNKRKICVMSRELYERIFALPESEGGPLLRFLMAQ